MLSQALLQHCIKRHCGRGQTTQCSARHCCSTALNVTAVKVKRRGLFVPQEREFVIDIDLSDYNDVRTCCDKAGICTRCWGFMAVAVHALDTALREVRLARPSRCAAPAAAARRRMPGASVGAPSTGQQWPCPGCLPCPPAGPPVGWPRRRRAR